jgi:hypothetical protein
MKKLQTINFLKIDVRRNLQTAHTNNPRPTLPGKSISPNTVPYHSQSPASLPPTSLRSLVLFPNPPAPNSPSPHSHQLSSASTTTLSISSIPDLFSHTHPALMHPSLLHIFSRPTLPTPVPNHSVLHSHVCLPLPNS